MQLRNSLRKAVFHRARITFTIRRNCTTGDRAFTERGTKSNEVGPSEHRTARQDFQVPRCHLTFTVPMNGGADRVHCCARRIYFLESLRIATNRSNDRVKFVLPRNLSPSTAFSRDNTTKHRFIIDLTSISRRAE